MYMQSVIDQNVVMCHKQLKLTQEMFTLTLKGGILKAVIGQ